MTNNLTQEKLTQIVHCLNFGSTCYVHKKTGKVLEMMEETFVDIYEEEMEDQRKEILENQDAYWKIESMDNPNSYKLMEYFVDTIYDKSFRKDLLNALNEYAPFKGFKNVLVNSKKYQQKWSQFRRKKMTEWVYQQMGGLAY